MNFSCLKITYIDVLSIPVKSKDLELFKIVPIKNLSGTSISGGVKVIWVEKTPSWMKSIIEFHKDHALLEENEKAYKLRRRTIHFIIQGMVQYKRFFSSSHTHSMSRRKYSTYFLKKFMRVYGASEFYLEPTKLRSCKSLLLHLQIKWHSRKNEIRISKNSHKRI